LTELVLVLLQIIADGYGSNNRGDEKPFGLWFVIFWFAVGGVIGAISLLIVKHSIISSEWLRYIILVGCPLAAGTFAYCLEQYRFPSEAKPLLRLHFLRAFGFALGLLIVRHQHFVWSL
jgi:hypothetical protein